MKRIAIFASGTGTNAKKIIEHFAAHEDIEVALIVSNRKEAKVLDIAKNNDISTLVITKAELNDADFILEKLSIYQLDLIVLAGFLLLIPQHLVSQYPDRIVNIHPALLPAFGGKGMYGMNVHRAVKESGATETGITIHYVNEKYDDGATIFQASVPVLATHSPEDIAKQVQALEHQHFAKTIERMLTKP